MKKFFLFAALVLAAFTSPVRALSVVEFVAPESWGSDVKQVTAADFPNFSPVSQEAAKTWDGNTGNLIYAIDGTNISICQFMNGSFLVAYTIQFMRAQLYSDTSAGTKWYYTTSGNQDIDNTAVETKTVKRIVKGQLLIERDGKLFNALGAEVK